MPGMPFPCITNWHLEHFKLEIEIHSVFKAYVPKLLLLVAAPIFLALSILRMENVGSGKARQVQVTVNEIST